MESVLRRLGDRASPYLTADRIRAAGILLFVSLWGFYAYAVSNPGLRDRFDNLKGADFVLWYTLGDFGRTGDLADLYRGPQFLEERQFALVPESKGDYFVCLYPPQMTALFAPLAGLPYLHALLFWSVIGVAAYTTCIYEAYRTCPGLWPFAGIVAVCAAAYPPFFEQIAHGQCAIVSLAFVTVAYLALHRGWPIIAGVAIGALSFKPTLAATGVIVFVLAGEWRILFGVILGAGLQYGAATFVYGFDVMTAYMRALIELGEAVQQQTPRPFNVHCLRAFWSLLIPEPRIARGLYIASAVGLLFLAWRAWRRNGDVGVRFAAVLLATVLVSPHLYVYDLLILAPALLVLADRAIRLERPPAPGTYVALCYALPLFGPLAILTHVQLSVPAFVATLYLVGRQATAGERSAAPRG
jgi:alpha-1,2-mannosyltransferase